jgi:hypothetical protein
MILFVHRSILIYCFNVYGPQNELQYVTSLTQTTQEKLNEVLLLKFMLISLFIYMRSKLIRAALRVPLCSSPRTAST